MRVFKGCVIGREIAYTRKGANPLTTTLVTKTDKTPAHPASTTPPAENPEMNAAEVAKAATLILSMNDVTKAHYLALAPEAQAKFIELTPEAMQTEAEAAKAAKDAAAAAAAALTAGATEREVAQSAKITTLSTEVETLKSRLADSDVEKRANSEFAGSPVARPAWSKLLKAYAKLPDDARKASEDLLKAQCDLAKRAGGELGFTEEEAAKSFPAHAELARTVAELRKSDPKMSEGAARAHVLTGPGPRRPLQAPSR